MNRLINYTRYAIFYSISFLFNIMYSLKDNKVLFLSDVRTVMGGNLKSVYDFLEGQDYERVIEFKGDRRVRRSFKEKLVLIYHLSTSKYILLEDLSESITLMKVRKNQEIIQLWHGPGAFKRFGWSRLKNGENIGKIHKGYKKYTKATVSSEDIKWCYAEAFGISENKIKATGFARTDLFFDEQYIDEVKHKFYAEYPHLSHKKIVLFAPTYRGVKVNDASYDFSKLDLDKLYENFHDEYIFIVKWHPALFNNIDRGIVQGPDYTKYNDFFLDFSHYRDINDLLIVADLLITDYSSLIFDYVLLNKPIVYYAYDLEQYAGHGGRGLYFDFQEYVYGKVASNIDELIQSIKNNDLMEEERKVFFNKFMGECDGHSTEKTCKWIFNLK